MSPRRLSFASLAAVVVAVAASTGSARAGELRLGVEGGGGLATIGALSYEAHFGGLLLYRPSDLFEVGAYGTLHGATEEHANVFDFGARAQFISGGFRYGFSAGFSPAIGDAPYARHGLVWGLHAGFPELYRSQSVALGMGANLAYVSELPASSGKESVRLAFLLTGSFGLF